LSALHANHPLPPGRSLALISVKGWVNPMAIVWLEGLGQLKSSEIRNRTCDLWVCSIAPQPTLLLLASKLKNDINNFSWNTVVGSVHSSTCYCDWPQSSPMSTLVICVCLDKANLTRTMQFSLIRITWKECDRDHTIVWTYNKRF
jgi:hypothetical protein